MWAQQMVQEAVDARAGERISGRVGVLAWRTAREETRDAHPIPSHGPNHQDRGELLPLDVLQASGGRASWGFEVVSLK